MPRNSSAATIGLQSTPDCGIGTLLWVGDRNASPFGDAYRYCESHVSQLAFRPTLGDAVARPASDVRGIVLCLQHDAHHLKPLWDQVCQRHTGAIQMLLLGPLVAGSRPAPIETFSTEGIWWHGWQNRLPERLRDCGVINSLSSTPRSLAIVSRDRMIAEALLAVASVASIPAVVCRPDSLKSVQNFDEYWWDDSATDGMPLGDVVSSVSDGGRHLLISHFVTPQLCHQAISAGFERVIAKPGDYHALLRRVSQGHTLLERQAA